MFDDHLKVITVIKEAGEVVGRKKLQKMIYIAKKLNFPFQEKYEFHFYGPYSEELTLRVEELCNLGYVHEIKEKVSGYSQYRYSLNNEGEDFLTSYGKKIPKLGECVRSMNEQSSRFLELVSTILFFSHLPADEVKVKIQTLKAKQKYSDAEIQEGYTFISQLENCIVQ
ncbi:YwgA family protein [Fictibacillus sp. KIGAM418]|uniref:YwgA family protein n=1 Tax=Fictibacillus marinisediminis TaxID=2878389 RepID=A0A9X2BF29_9BACL|nr:YwgA family protein [Fictibacillus marinisediminis]